MRYHYYVEGNCEKKLIDEFKKQQLPIISGKIDVFNAVQEEFTNTRLRMLPENTVVILVFDTDTGIVEILKRNLEILKKYPRVKETWCVMQVHNLEDEIKRSTDVKEIKDLLGSKSNKEYKHDFCLIVSGLLFIMTIIIIKKEAPGILPDQIASPRPMVKTMVILSDCDLVYNEKLGVFRPE